MAKNSNSPYAKRRRKVKKEELNASPFKGELKDDLKSDRNKKIVGVVAVIIVIVMVGTLIFPYFTGGQSNYQLPNSVLTADENTDDVAYSPQSILVGQVYNREDTEYYVLFGSAQDTAELTSKLVRFNYYLVDPNNALNKSLAEGSNVNLPQSPSEIKISEGLGLIKIVNGKATEFASGKAEVNAMLEKIDN